MLETLVTAVVDALKADGLNAAPAYERTPLERGGQPLVCVSVRSAERTGSGFAEYLGVFADPETGVERESYGMRADVELGVDVYVSKKSENASLECVRVFDRAAQCMSALSAGWKMRSISCGEAAPDGETGLFRCKGSMRGVAYLIAQPDGDSGAFTDFILKGVLRS